MLVHEPEQKVSGAARVMGYLVRIAIYTIIPIILIFGIAPPSLDHGDMLPLMSANPDHLIVGFHLVVVGLIGYFVKKWPVRMILLFIYLTMQTVWLVMQFGELLDLANQTRSSINDVIALTYELNSDNSDFQTRAILENLYLPVVFGFVMELMAAPILAIERGNSAK